MAGPVSGLVRVEDLLLRGFLEGMVVTAMLAATGLECTREGQLYGYDLHRLLYCLKSS